MLAELSVLLGDQHQLIALFRSEPVVVDAGALEGIARLANWDQELCSLALAGRLSPEVAEHVMSARSHVACPICAHARTLMPAEEALCLMAGHLGYRPPGRWRRWFRRRS